MSKFVVSANYRDRTSPYKWLVRESGKPLDTAVACKEVVAHNVEFVQSTDGEYGFGCFVVGIADEASVIDPEPKPELSQEIPAQEVTLKPEPMQEMAQLTFYNDGNRWNAGFRHGETPVSKVKRLELKADGAMFALLE